jgi:hypothetical protein
MTAAQKTAKAKFKQAIAYRQKTGVSLKEAFAHIYGKKIANTRKLVFDYLEVPKGKKPKLVKVIGKAPKKKVAKKVVRKVVKKKAAPKKVAKKKLTPRDYDKRYSAKKPGKRTSASGNTYYESRPNRSDKGKLLGIKKYNYEQLDNIRLTRVNNDINGNPRYVVHFLEFLNNEENSFLPFSKKYEYALKKAKKIGGRKFHNKQYGGGIVFQSYNTDNLKEQIIDVMETTPKIKY